VKSGIFAIVVGENWPIPTLASWQKSFIFKPSAEVWRQIASEIASETGVGRRTGCQHSILQVANNRLFLAIRLA
jgi:hypothetical protein